MTFADPLRGLPPTDINNLMLFLDYNDKIRHVVVCYDRSDHPDLQRLTSIFGEAVVRNEDARAFLQARVLG